MEHPLNDNHPQSTPEQKRPTKQEQRFEAFDLLRVIFSFAIVAYKTQIFYIPKFLISSDVTIALSDYILSGMVGALAVPVFLQISLFLFSLKSKKSELAYFIQKRLPRLVYLYLFWVSTITLFDILFVGKLAAIQEETSSLKRIILFIISGHNTPYFFFFSLIFVTILAEGLILLFDRLKESSARINLCYFLLTISSVLVFSSSTIEPIIESKGIQSALLQGINNLTGWDYNPLNFLPYVFTAAITTQEYQNGDLKTLTEPLKRKIYTLLALTITFFTLEWVLTSNRLLIQVDQAPLDHYMRLSLVFGSWFLLYIALLSKYKASETIKFISSCSLGIYGFHVFFIFKGHVNWEEILLFGQIVQTHLVLKSITVFLIVSAGSIALTVLAKKTRFIKNFV